MFSMFSRSQPPKEELKFTVELTIENEDSIFTFKGPKAEVEDKLHYIKNKLLNNPEYPLLVNEEFDVQGVKGTTCKLSISVDAAELSNVFCYLASIQHGFNADDFLPTNENSTFLLYAYCVGNYGQNKMKVYQAIQSGNQLDPSTLPAKELPITENVKSGSYCNII